MTAALTIWDHGLRVDPEVSGRARGLDRSGTDAGLQVLTVGCAAAAAAGLLLGVYAAGRGWLPSRNPVLP